MNSGFDQCRFKEIKNKSARKKSDTCNLPSLEPRAVMTKRKWDDDEDHEGR